MGDVPRRREPPPFLPVTVARTERVSSRLIRITLTGPDLDRLVIEQPGSSVRLLLVKLTSRSSLWSGSS